MECPHCKGTMVPSPAPDRRDIIKPMVQAGATAPYAADKADQQLEKEESLGVIHTCASCRYQTRVKDEGKKRKKDAA